MLKSIIAFIQLASGFAFLGILFIIFGMLATSEPSPQLPILANIGVLIFLFSPILAGCWLWLMGRNRSARTIKATGEEERKDRLRRKFLERKRLMDSVDRHRSILLRNLDRAVKRNDYGALVSDSRGEALQEFFASIDLDMATIDENEAAEIVFEQLNIRKTEDLAVGFDANSLPFDGYSFEKWVAEALIGFGWKASVTSGSGDQGIDVIAEKEGKKLGLQCKLYSSAIGNKAVQEAHSGKAYYGADAVAVLSNASYTSSAKDLASVTGVKLLSHNDIPDIYDIVFVRG